VTLPTPDSHLEELPPSSLEVQPGVLRLSPGHLVRMDGWGMAVDCVAHAYQPETVDAIREVFSLARRTGRKVCLRGGGNSYGDAAILQDGIILDLTRMNRIVAWDPQSGVVDAEPGVTLEQLWKCILPDGWWPPVVSGTMFTTVGGCAAMNIHGKNNFRAGTFGEHIQEFDFLAPTGDLFTVSRESDPDLFHAAISGAGLLGVFTRVRLQMKKIHSGLLRVEAFNTATLREMARGIDARADSCDYLVGWVDCLAPGRKLGRGIVHAAKYLREGQDPRPKDSLTVAAQELPDKVLGVFPKALLHHFMGPFVNNPGVRLVNSLKFHSSRLHPQSSIYYQSHGAFAFLLDYVPGWKFAYRPVGLIQYQPFIPREHAVQAFEQIIRRSQEASLPPYLGVFKKHRPDPFLLSHAVDGFSLALDYRVTEKNRSQLWDLAHRLDEIVLAAGGRFYFAKDATLTAEGARRYLGEKTIERLWMLKRRLDPEDLLQTDLARRVLSDRES
jgi:FAD/FMN-containing dehydrogenase